jgi:hypothetical protein
MARFRRTNRLEGEYGGSGDESTVSKAEAAPASGRGAVRGRITRDGAVEPWHLQPKVKTAVELQRELKLAATAAATMTTHGKSVSDLARRLNIVVNLDDGEDDGVGSEAEIAGAAAGDSYETSTSISASKLRVIVGDLNLAPLARKLPSRQVQPALRANDRPPNSQSEWKATTSMGGSYHIFQLQSNATRPCHSTLCVPCRQPTAWHTWHAPYVGAKDT